MKTIEIEAWHEEGKVWSKDRRIMGAWKRMGFKDVNEFYDKMKKYYGLGKEPKKIRIIVE